MSENDIIQKTNVNQNILNNPHQEKTSDLDENILKSKLNDTDKARLYTLSLERYLFHRKKYMNPKIYSIDSPKKRLKSWF